MDPQRNLAFQTNIVADAIKHLKLDKNMRILSYDVNRNQFPEGIEATYSFPQYFFFPAYHKGLPYRKA